MGCGDAVQRHILAGDVGVGGHGAGGGQVVVAPVACAVGFGQGRDIGHGDRLAVAGILVVESA